MRVHCPQTLCWASAEALRMLTAIFRERILKRAAKMSEYRNEGHQQESLTFAKLLKHGITSIWPCWGNVELHTPVWSRHADGPRSLRQINRNE